MRSNMFKKLLCVAIVLMFPFVALAQTGSITGTVTDAATGETLPGASVLVTELGTGGSTDLDGEYTIRGIQYGTYRLRVSYVGYRTVTRTIELNQANLTVNFELRDDPTGLDEVVVTGIASRTSRAVSEVAVSRIDATTLTETQSYQDLSQLISGKVAGVTVQPSGGTVGAGVRFNVRSGGGLGGAGQPLIYIDGVRIDNSQLTGAGRGGQGTGTLADINMDEVESIDILKGPAAAALYGTSGSNGVVLITTKRGQSVGGRGTLNATFRTTQGVSEFVRTEQFDQFMSTESIKSVFEQGSLNHNNVSVSGGSEFIRFYTSYDQRLEEGIMNRNYMDRQNFRANFDAFPREDLTISVSAGYTWNEVELPDNDNNIRGYLGNTVLASGGDDGAFGFTPRDAIDAISDISRTTRFIGSAQLQYRPIRNLEISASAGYDGSDVRRDETIPPGFIPGALSAGDRFIYNRINQQYTYDINARYTYNITPELNASTVVGTQMFDRTIKAQNFRKRGFSTALISNIGAGEDFIGGNESFLQTREAGVFFEQALNYNEQFMFSFGGRQDFAAAIGDEAPNIFYPKVSAAVRIDNLVDLPDFASFLKFRVAFGQTGSLPAFNDGASRLWTATNSGYGTGGIINFVGNPEIKPETITEIEFGVEAELFDRLGLDLTYYMQEADDSIIDFRRSPSTGITNLVPENVGSIKGWGFESAINYTAFQSLDTQLDLGIIYSYQDTEVQDLGGAQPIFDGFGLNVIKEGIQRSAFYVPVVHGALFDENGAYAGVDADDERSVVGSPIPIHSGSFNLNLRVLRNLNVYALVDWAYDVYVYNNTKQFAVIFRNLDEFEQLASQLGFGNLYQGDDGDPLTPGTEEYTDAANRFAMLSSSFDYGFIERADWLKLREVSISYNFRDILASTGADSYVRDLNVSVSGRNLFTSTKYSGIDPEVNFAGARSTSRGQDFLTLPPSRSFLFTVSLGL